MWLFEKPRADTAERAEAGDSDFLRMRGKRGLDEVSNTDKKMCHWSPQKIFS